MQDDPPIHTRVAGMTHRDGHISLVCLGWAGGEWGVEDVREGPLDHFLLDPALLLDVPVVLEAAAWTRSLCPAMPYAAPWSVADSLRAAGWDVRPPRWRGGAAEDPPEADIVKTSLEFPFDDTVMPTTKAYRAFMLAAWGITHDA